MNIEQLKPNKRLTNRTALKIFIHRMLSVMKRKHFYHYSSVSHSELISILPVFFFFFLPQSKSVFLLTILGVTKTVCI